MPIWTSEIKELEKLYESFKGQLPELGKELVQLIRSDDPNVILLYSRRCLEVIIADICVCELQRPRGTEPLKGIIDKLQHEEKIPSHIITSMHNLNSLSTYGAHPKDFDPEQIKPVLINLDIIIKWYLKYKETQVISKQRIAEVKDATFISADTTLDLQKSYKKLIIWISGVALIVIVVLALFMFDIIGGGKQIDELEKSIAILPFENWSSEEEFQHLGDAIANEINTYLSLVKQFHVVSYTSSSRYKGSEKPSLPQIGRELGANFIIEGTVERQLEDVSIHVQVIKAADDDHIWAQEFKGKWKDIFTIRANISKNVTEELNAVLTPQEKVLIEKRETENPEAYNYYLQGRFHWHKRTEEGLQKSVEFFQKALSIDPDYALAYAGMADAFFIQAWWGWISWTEGNIKAKKYATQALDIDNNLSEAHTVLGGVLTYYDWKYEQAREELLLAIKLNPNNSNAHQYYSELLDILRIYDEAIAHINTAIELDPFIYMYHSLSTIYYYHVGRFKESLEEIEIADELSPFSTSPRWLHFYIQIKQENNLEACNTLKEILLMDTSTVKYSDTITELYNKYGLKGIFTFLINLELKQLKPSTWNLAKWNVFLGKDEEALNWLDKAMEENVPSMPRINCDPDFDKLRLEPRFQALIKQMGLSEYQNPK